ncbi:MAG TPA: beta-ketoacyl-ACP synthase II [bacterium]|nr:beta-ketoacyl-ACP synthase II [bacterium]HOL46635.1 beta-ketoacyl-ACP synthase II [bacterium]HPQ17793.1 beta-ketoacyl-ACP synthase II [bacterium]
MKRRVVITGFGVLAPDSLGIDNFWKRIVEGPSSADFITYFDVSQFDTKFACELKVYKPEDHFSKKELRRKDRFVQYALVAAREAYKNAQLDNIICPKERIGVYVSSGIGGINTFTENIIEYYKGGPRKISPLLIPMFIINLVAGEIAIEFGLKGPNLSVVTACAASSHSIGEAFRCIQNNEADIILAGGTEAAISPIGLGGFSNMKAISERNDDPKRASRPFDKERDGFVMGEGAGIIVLEELEHAKKRNANIICEVKGYGKSCDAHHITAPDPDGEGAYRCMKNAIEDACLTINDIQYINAHGTSTPLNDRVETLAIKKLFGERSKDIFVSSTKSVIGHLLGAAGAVELIATALAIKKSEIPPTINYEFPEEGMDLNYVPNKSIKCEIENAMSNSFGFGGHNASIVIGKYHS